MDKLKILLAEDEYLVMMGIKANLEELGHKIVGEAMNGKEAVELALEKSPDLIIIDINMPYLDGIEAIKKINEKIVIPSIIVTGYSDTELIRKASQVGVFAYLVKPIEINELKPAIQVAMQRFKEFEFLSSELNNTKLALENRKFIEKAKGILMETLSLSEAEAMKHLQKKSQVKNMKLVEIAKKILKMADYLN